MATDIDELFRERTVRSWLAVQIAAILGWLATIAVLSTARAHLLIIVLGTVLLALAAGFMLDPRRSWWGAGPTAVMTDPAARRRYQRLMIVWLIAGLGVMFAAVVVVVATGIVTPPNG